MTFEKRKDVHHEIDHVPSPLPLASERLAGTMRPPSPSGRLVVIKFAKVNAGGCTRTDQCLDCDVPHGRCVLG